MLKFSTSLFVALMAGTALFATEELKELSPQRQPVPFKEELELTYQFIPPYRVTESYIIPNHFGDSVCICTFNKSCVLDCMGVLLNDGESRFETEIPRAISFFKEAITSGSADAELSLGQIYAYVPGYINFKEAEALLLKALDHKAQNSLFVLGKFYRDFFYIDKAIIYFEQAAQKQNKDTFFHLAQIYHYKKNDLPQAIHWYEEALKVNDWRAYYGLGDIFYSKRDIKKAIECFEKGVEKGDKHAIFLLARMTKDIPQAIHLCEEALKLENWDAYAHLAQIFQHDKKDIKKAIEYLEKGIEKGSDYALFALAQLYQHGSFDSSSDHEKAIELYKKSIFTRFGFDVSNMLYELIPDKVEANFWLCCRDFKKNVKEFEELKDLFSTKDESLKKENLTRVKEIAEKGNFFACHVLGLYYQELAEPIRENDTWRSYSTPRYAENAEENAKMAFAWFTKAMELGSRPSILALGLIYDRGLKSIEPNTEKAIELYRLLAKEINYSSADSFIWDAASELANCYLSLGDIESAFYWYQSYSAPNTYFSIAEAFRFGSGKVEKNLRKAIEWYEKGVEAKEEMSIERLAEIYLEGRDGIEQNVEKALQLYLKSEELGGCMCLEKIGNIYFEGKGSVKKDLKKALSYYEKAHQESACWGFRSVDKLIEFYSGQYGDEFEDYKKAVELYEEARTTQALFIRSPWLTKAYKKLAQQMEKENIIEAIKYYEKPAKDDDQESCLRLSEIFEQGIGGIEKSPERAAYWREKIESIKQQKIEHERYMQQRRLREEEEKKKREEAEKKKESTSSKKLSSLEAFKRSEGKIVFAENSEGTQVIPKETTTDPLKGIVGIFQSSYQDTLNAWFRLPEEIKFQYKIEFTPGKGYCVTPF